MDWSSSPTTVMFRVPAASSVHELGLRPVRVLELVHEHVAVALPDLLPRRRPTSRSSRTARLTWSPKSMNPASASSAW